jgi:hypothetical protein
VYARSLPGRRSTGIAGGFGSLRGKIRGVKWLCVLTTLALVACSSDDGPEPFDSQDCTNLAFEEVNSANTSGDFQGQVRDALQLLCRSQSDSNLGFETYKSIVTGRVQVDVLEDLSDLDYSTVLVFYGLAPGTPRADALPAILADLAGYMWGNRVYVVLGSSTEALAATLMHEVNHVLNRSDENYYLPLDPVPTEAERIEILGELRVDEGRGFAEEYRAFYLEAVLAGAALDVGKTESMATLKAEVAALYEWTTLDLSRFPDFPDGLLIPDDAGWAARPASFCSPTLTYFPCP